MKKRPYGNTGKMVSEIGFGGWQLGNTKDWCPMNDEEGIKLIHEALDREVNFFDTAPNYGLGKSEELIGKGLKGRRDKAIINTKFGHGADDILNFSSYKIRSSVESSLRRLQTDYLDSVLLHNPPLKVLRGNTKHYEVLEKLKEEGKIITYGASVDSSEEMFELMKNTNSGIIEIMFNIFHQEPAEAFKLAKEKKIGLVAKVPLDSGWLSGKYSARSSFSDIRGRWAPEVLERRARLLEKIKFITNENTTMAQAALQFILSYIEISTVIPGAKNLRQLEENILSSNNIMPEETIKALQAIWIEDIKNNRLPW